jgi:hypothetical protein
MPSFKDSKNPALNPLLAIKTELIRRQKDAFRGEDIVATPAVSQQIVTPYGDLFKLLVGINAQYREVALELEGLKGTTTVALTDRFKGSSTALSQALKMGNEMLKRIKYDLSGFSDDELRGIEREYNELKGNEQVIEEDLARFEREANAEPAEGEEAGPASSAQQRRFKRKRLDNLMSVFSGWHQQYKIFIKRLGDALRKTNRVADVVGAGYSGGLMPSHYAITTASLPRRFI